MRIHIRRAKLLGLDAPTKLDVTGIYQRGGADVEAEQFARDAVPLVVQRLSLHRRDELPLRLGQLGAADGEVPGVPGRRVVELVAAATQLGSRVEQE